MLLPAPGGIWLQKFLKCCEQYLRLLFCRIVTTVTYDDGFNIVRNAADFSTHNLTAGERARKGQHRHLQFSRCSSSLMLRNRLIQRAVEIETCPQGFRI